MTDMNHVDSTGAVTMVDVGHKEPTDRVAVVEGFVRLTPAHEAALGSLAKGDAIVTAQIAGIQAGKRCSELIPLCHTIPLSFLDVAIVSEEGGLRIRAEARAFAVTGVEMEAYVAVSIAGVTLIDMLKGVDPNLCLTDISLLEKRGGKSEYRR